MQIWCTRWTQHVQMLKCTNAQMHKCSSAQMLQYSSYNKCTNAQMRKCSNAQLLKCSQEDDDGFGRDVFNEKPAADEQILQADTAVASKIGHTAVIRTTLGDIHINLEGDRCPRTVENFCVHSRNHYYDNVIFHRVIKGFMIQTGDPLGDGTGGESIWGTYVDRTRVLCFIANVNVNCGPCLLLLIVGLLRSGIWFHHLWRLSI